MDEFDGLCAVAANDSYPEVERAELPFLLKWTSNSPAAQARKLQTIKNLWVEAVNQIPTGEAGLIYLAYEEGHRPSLADARTDAIRELTKNIYFERRAIYISLTVVSRLFLNVVHEGRPDFIESSIPLAEGRQRQLRFLDTGDAHPYLHILAGERASKCRHLTETKSAPILKSPKPTPTFSLAVLFPQELVEPQFCPTARVLLLPRYCLTAQDSISAQFV